MSTLQRSSKCTSRRETPAPAKSETARGRLSDMLVGSRAGPAWRNRPLQAEREGADVCTCLQRSGTQRTLLRVHPDGGDQPAKGPDAAADRTGLVAGEVRSVD